MAQSATYNCRFFVGWEGKKLQPISSRKLAAGRLTATEIFVRTVAKPQQRRTIDQVNLKFRSV